MKKDEIHLADIKRILFGLAPPGFLIEVFVRTIIIFIVLLLVIRLLGKRMSGQLTIMELAVMLTLGAIVAVPMQMPDRGILQGVILLICIAFFQRSISWLGVVNGKIEDITQGKASMLVKDGVLQLDEMKKLSISHQQLFAELRQENIFNLGKVDRVYMEASGMFSVFQAEEEKPGLAILPADDKEILEIEEQAFIQDKAHIALLACCNCGNIKPKTDQQACKNCGNNDWVDAMK